MARVYTNEEMRGGDDMFFVTHAIKVGIGTNFSFSFVVDYYPCKYKEGADPQAMGPISTFRTDWLYNSAN